jgi:hypothetical protein
LIPAFFVLVFVLGVIGTQAQAAEPSNIKGSYWKNYFSSVEEKAVKKNAQQYVLSQIQKKSADWKGIFTSFNIKKGSINNDAVKDGGLGTDKIQGLDTALQEKLSASGGTLTGIFNWAENQTFPADKLTGEYPALDGSKITNITASQISAVPYSGATGAIDLNGKDLVNMGNVGIGTTAPLGKLIVKGVGTTTGIGFQTQDSVGAAKVTILDNGNVGIGTTNPNYILEVIGTSLVGNILINGSSLLKNTNDSLMYISGGSSTALGANIRLYGESHATTPNITKFLIGTSEKVRIAADGKVGIGTTTPATTLDVNGQVKIQKSSSQPFACDATHDGTIALTSTYRTCVCKGSSTTWVYTSDGTTSCVWQ